MMFETSDIIHDKNGFFCLEDIQQIIEEWNFNKRLGSNEFDCIILKTDKEFEEFSNQMDPGETETKKDSRLLIYGEAYYIIIRYIMVPKGL